MIATVRDLARQLPSAWQQLIKSGGTTTYQRFLRQAQSREQEGSDSVPGPTSTSPRCWHAGRRPWDPSGSTWSRCPRRAAHPKPCSSATAASWAWTRTEWCPRRRASTPASDGSRRSCCDGSTASSPPSCVLDRSTATSASGSSPPRCSLPRSRARSGSRPSSGAWCDEVADRQSKTIEEAGYAVTGQLADLRCPDEAFADGDDRPTNRDVTAAAVQALVHILALRGQAARRRLEPGAPGSPGREHGRSRRARAGRLMRRIRGGTPG